MVQVPALYSHHGHMFEKSIHHLWPGIPNAAYDVGIFLYLPASLPLFPPVLLSQQLDSVPTSNLMRSNALGTFRADFLISQAPSHEVTDWHASGLRYNHPEKLMMGKEQEKEEGKWEIRARSWSVLYCRFTQ